PVVLVPSAFNDGSVRLLSGTSMAAPHVPGLAALLWSANPALFGDIPGTEAILAGSAVRRYSTECGSLADDIPNNTYGWGRGDARQAVAQARVEVPWLSLPPAVSLPANGAKQIDVTLDARQVPGP